MTASCQTKSTIVIRFNLFQVCPPVSFFVFAVFFIVSFNVINGYFISLYLNFDQFSDTAPLASR